MRVLVIPDVHLKTWMFERARQLLEQAACNQVVCLMDIPDDWNKSYDIASYEETFNKAIAFAKDYPQTLWVYGNHELSYKWSLESSGFSGAAAYTVRRKLLELEQTVKVPIRYVQQIDNVIFSHGGLSSYFVNKYVPQRRQDDVDEVLSIINNLGERELWNDNSPLWLRPQYAKTDMYKEKELLQIVGHTPVEKITRVNNLISCDTFSTCRDGRSIGTRQFLIVDTDSWEYTGHL